MGLLTAAVMIAVINYVIVGLLGGLLVDWLMEVSASRLLLIGAAIGLVIGVIDYRLSAARWNRYVAGLGDVYKRQPTPCPCRRNWPPISWPRRSRPTISTTCRNWPPAPTGRRRMTP